MDGMKSGKPSWLCARRFTRVERFVLGALCWIAATPALFAQTPGLIEGDGWHKADVARATYKKADNSAVNGSGVKVCVMSDSIDNGQGALAAATLSGDIPAAPQFTPISGQEGSGKGEGLAMLEIVHKLAPGADLGFATGKATLARQEQNIQVLINAGCRIIVDDITNPLDAPFQDGRIAKAINAGTERGVLFISSAGNFGNRKYNASGVWEGDFSDGGLVPTLGTGRVHEFTPGNQAAVLTAPTQEIWLYWSDPYDSATSKYRLWVSVARMGGFFDYRVTAPNRPYQFLDARLIADPRLNCGGSTNQQDNCFQTDDFIAVMKDEMIVPGNPTPQPSPPRFLRLDVGSGKINVGTNGRTSGRNAAESVLSVGAVKVPSTGVFTASSAAEPGSSDGQRRIFYNPDNSPITPDNFLAGTRGGRVIDKPDLAAANRVKTTLPASTNPSESKLNPFEGTSAAAPHVAGIAALILSYQPDFTPSQVKQLLIASAIDIESAGWDDVSGFGIPMADKALELATKPSIYTWVGPAAPPSNAVTAPEPPYRAVCKGNSVGRLKTDVPAAGYWDGTQCLGSIGGNVLFLEKDVQFLTAMQSAQKWVSGTQKIIPGDIGVVPPNTINAGNDAHGEPQVLCSRGGRVGWVYYDSCEISVKENGPSGQRNSTVLVGTMQ